MSTILDGFLGAAWNSSRFQTIQILHTTATKVFAPMWNELWVWFNKSIQSHTHWVQGTFGLASTLIGNSETHKSSLESQQFWKRCCIDYL